MLFWKDLRTFLFNGMDGTTTFDSECELKGQKW